MATATLRDRLRYSFDNFMAKGTVALIFGLAMVSGVTLLLFTVVVYLTGVAPVGDGGGRPGLLEIFWMELMRTLDAGTMGGDAGSWTFLLLMLGVTFAGIFVISTFIGVLTSGIEARLEELRKGRSKVIESGHTVILGWSSQVFAILNELAIANANKRRSCVVVLGEKDKVEMEEEISSRVPEPGGMRVVCRSGSSMDLTDLDMVSLHTAKSIIVLPPEDASTDSNVIKTLLAITNNPKRRQEAHHIVAQITNPESMGAAHLAGRGEAELVLAGDLISRITVQTCRQSGLSVVYTELLDFDGDEIYFQEEPKLVGQSYGKALFSYEECAVMGLRKRDGRILLNPPSDHLIEGGDKIIAIAEDDDALKLAASSSPPAVDASKIRQAASPPRGPERTLILGWNWRIATIIAELDKYVASGSQVVVIADKPEAQADLGRIAAGLKNQKLLFKAASTTDRAVLEEATTHQFDQIILLCSDTVHEQEADAQTLVTLLHLRDIGEKMGRSFAIVSEMLDLRNRELAEVTRADDFIVGTKLVSLMMSQVAENKALNAVFTDLFSEEGSEIYLKPAANYVMPGVPVNFHTVLESARARGESAIGYRLHADRSASSKGYGVVVNPTKTESITFSESDKVIVLAEN